MRRSRSHDRPSYRDRRDRRDRRGGGGTGRGGSTSRGADYSRNRDRDRGRNRRQSRSRSHSDGSRERERRRRRMQAECIRRAGGYQKLADSEGKEPVRLFWDGFQWVAKTGHSTALQNDPVLTNSTRKMRRLYFGNLPLHLGLTETAFQDVVWQEMRRRGYCNSPEENPVLCVWFAKDKGNYGFVEFASVAETERALTMDGMICHGVPLKVSRPNDYSTATTQQSQAMALMGQQSAQMLQMQQAGLPMDPVGVVNSIPPGPVFSKIVKLAQVVDPTTIRDVAEYKDVLDDVKDGMRVKAAQADNTMCFNTESKIISAVIITPENISENLPYNVGDVFLEFSDIAGADQSIQEMNGRKYEGRPVRMSKVEMDEFESLVRPLMKAS